MKMARIKFRLVPHGKYLSDPPQGWEAAIVDFELRTFEENLAAACREWNLEYSESGELKGVTGFWLVRAGQEDTVNRVWYCAPAGNDGASDKVEQAVHSMYFVFHHENLGIWKDINRDGLGDQEIFQWSGLIIKEPPLTPFDWENNG